MTIDQRKHNSSSAACTGRARAGHCLRGGTRGGGRDRKQRGRTGQKAAAEETSRVPAAMQSDEQVHGDATSRSMNWREQRDLARDLECVGGGGWGTKSRDLKEGL